MAPLVLSAHPGHGIHEEDGLLHYLTSPLHLLSFGVAVGIGVLFYYFRKTGKSPFRS